MSDGELVGGAGVGADRGALLATPEPLGGLSRMVVFIFDCLAGGLAIGLLAALTKGRG